MNSSKTSLNLHCCKCQPWNKKVNSKKLHFFLKYEILGKSFTFLAFSLFVSSGSYLMTIFGVFYTIKCFRKRSLYLKIYFVCIFLLKMSIVFQMYIFKLKLLWKTINLLENKSYIENAFKYRHDDGSSFKIPWIRDLHL